MTPGADRNHLAHDLDGDAFVRQQLAGLDSDLMRGMSADNRLESGVPEGQRSDSLDFIQMTGLTRAPLRQPAGGTEPYRAARADLDPDAPLSFYEQGVTDVDESMGVGQSGSSPLDINLDADLVPDHGAKPLGSGSSPSVRAFQDIIAGLEHPGGGDVEIGTANADATPDEKPDSGAVTTPGALLSILDELESALDSPGPLAANAPATEPVSPASDPETAAGVETGPTTMPEERSLPEADTDTDTFDAMVESIDPVDSPALSTPATADEDITEDWDALLDSACVPVPSPEIPEPRTAGPVRSGALAEAEQLMQALGQSPSRPQQTPPPAAYSLPAEIAPAFETPPETERALAADFAAVPPRRRSRRPSRIARKTRRIIKLVLFAGVFAAFLGSAWYFIIGPALEKPVDLEAKANRLMAERKFRDASAAFVQLARHMTPDQSERPNAQFRAAYALTLGDEVSMDDTKSRYETAIKLFKAFVEQYPEHPKRARAECIMGRLYFQLHDYDAAIAVLRDQVKPEQDPAAALTIFRYLARAHSMKGAYEEAETAYLQAATLPGNYSAETDYRELGDMFGKRAGLAEDESARKAFQDTAAAYWTKAMQVPGIGPADLDLLQKRLEWRSFTEDSGSEPAVTGGAQPGAEPAPAMPETATENPVAPETPAATEESGWIEDPAAEIEVLLPAPHAASEPPAGATPGSETALTPAGA